MDVKITGFNIHDAARDGQIRLGQFDVEVSGIRLVNCRLVRYSNGAFFALPPNIPNEHRGDRRSAVEFIDRTVRHEIQKAAVNAYRALGGTLAEKESAL